MTPPRDEGASDPGRDALERGPSGAGGRGAAERDASRRGARAPEKRVNWLVVLLASALPVGMVVWIATMSPEKRKQLFDSIPSGVAARSVAAAGALLAMVALVRLVLPGAKAAIASLLRAQLWCRSKKGATRLALYPVEFVVYLGWLLAQMLFAVDLVLIVACGAGFLLYAVRIVKPEMFGWLPGPH